MKMLQIGKPSPDKLGMSVTRGQSSHGRMWKRYVGFRAVVLCLLFGLALANPLSQASALAKPGKASATYALRVIDGDSLVLNGQHIRLFGIDAPEHSQTCTGASGEYACGQTALNALKTLIGSSEVTCIGSKHDRYKRLLATCYLGMTDINRWMVRNGYAVAYRKYSQAYTDVESQAKAQKLNLWAGAFQMPWEYRKSQ